MRSWSGRLASHASHECYLSFNLQGTTTSFQFVIGGDESSKGEECFVVEQPQDTAFVVKYQFPGAGFGSGSEAVVTLFDSK